ncbi:uncharacterized protein VTP21DRAFT_8068 [Calcarisporiella thermophila]|uniref:uncharacterized protein n=1 Tax=Calcarisporiella thermophila TaxID=911321 RepID=UPI0037424E1F
MDSDFITYDISCHKSPTRRAEYLERYFTCRFLVHPEKGRESDLMMMQLPNKLCVVCLAPTHPLLSHPFSSFSVSFKIAPSVRTPEEQQKSNGKQGKKNILPNVRPDTVVCEITSHDEIENEEKKYEIRAGVSGKVLEVNERVVNDSNLILRKPESEGFLFVLKLTKDIDLDRCVREPWKTLTRKQYEASYSSASSVPLSLAHVKHRYQPNTYGRNRLHFYSSLAFTFNRRFALHRLLRFI